jgi:hypothetical protein
MTHNQEQTHLAESSWEGSGSRRAVLPMIIKMRVKADTNHHKM